jgi:hypothetical protein
VSGPESSETTSEAEKQEVACEVFRQKMLEGCRIAFDKLGANKEDLNRSNGPTSTECEAMLLLLEKYAKKMERWLSDNTEIAPPPYLPAGAKPAWKRVQGMYKDLTGQITEAVSSKEFYVKWGMHFVRSIVRAHELKQCNNFKDPGVQF